MEEAAAEDLKQRLREKAESARKLIEKNAVLHNRTFFKYKSLKGYAVERHIWHFFKK